MSLPRLSGTLYTMRLSVRALHLKHWAGSFWPASLERQPTFWNPGGTNLLPWSLVGEAALTISGSPLGSLFGFLKGNRGLEEAKGLLDYIFFSIPTAMTLLQNCITSLLDSHNLLPVSMSFTPGHLPSHSQTILPKHQSQIPTQGPTMATQDEAQILYLEF